MIKQNSALYDQYARMEATDTPPVKGSMLEQCLIANPKLLESEIMGSQYRNLVSYAELMSGNLHCADFILGKDGQFKEDVDPFYCGETVGYLEALLDSAGVNFYLALASLHFLARQGKLGELIIEDDLGKATVNKTHYDYLYWQDETGRHHAELTDKIDFAVVEEYQNNTAKFFMKLAYEAYNAQLCINSSSTSLEDKHEAHKVLTKRYLYLAYMEDTYQHAFSYLLDRAFEHHCLAYPENSKQRESAEVVQFTEKLERYIKHREEIFNLQFEKGLVQFQDSATGYPRARTFLEWKESYDSAYRRDYVIAGETVERHSLHFDEREQIWWDTIDTLFEGELHSVTTITETPIQTPSPDRKNKSLSESLWALVFSSTSSATLNSSHIKLKKN